MMVVTGMHRSGTSLLAMTINALGQPFGDESAMYGADQWNERGYFEQRAVVDLNSRLITGFGRTDGGWKSLASQVGVPRTWPGQCNNSTRRQVSGRNVNAWSQESTDLRKGPPVLSDPRCMDSAGRG